MDTFRWIQRKIVPEMEKTLQIRYTILRTVLHAGAIGRRSLAQRLGETERSIRSDLSFLRQQGFLQTTSAGAALTAEGQAMLEEMDEFMRWFRGIQELEKELKAVLGLEVAMVIPGQNSLYGGKEELGRFAANYLHGEIGQEGILAVTGGSTLASIARAVGWREKKRPGLLVLPGRGGLGENVELEANTIAVELARGLGGRYRLLYLPDNLPPTMKESLKQRDTGLGEVLYLLQQANWLVHGIGQAEEMARRRHLPPPVLEELKGMGAVGEAFGYYFNQEGQVVYHTPSVGLQREDLQSIPRVIAVAGGALKAAAIMAVVDSRYQDVLITDEPAAREILRLAKKNPK